MSDSPKNLSDQIDDRLERHLPKIQDSIELKLTKQVDSLLKDRFESIVKLLGWAFGLVALAFTGFGVKTLFDVRDVARTTAIEEVKKKLRVDDPNSEFSRDVDKVIARGLINSYFLQFERHRDKSFNQDLRIAEIDLKRLLDLVSDPRTAETDFTDACELMFRSEQSRARNDQSLARTLIALGIASDEKYRWMRDQPEKRSVIFEFDKSQKLIPTARTLIADSKTDKVLVISAIRYLSKNLDKQSANQFEKLASSKDEEISYVALYGLASIAPDSPALKATLFPSQNNNEQAIADSVRLAIAIAKPGSRRIFDEDLLEDLRFNTASRVIQNAIDKDFVFRLSTAFSHRGGSSLAISNRPNFSTSYALSSELLLGSQARALDYLLKTAAKNGTQLTKALRALCLEDDGRCWGVVRVNLENGGKLVLESGVTLDKAAAPAGITLRPASPKPDAEILVAWTDSTATSKTSTLSKILDPGKVQFEVTPVRAMAPKEENEE